MSLYVIDDHPMVRQMIGMLLRRLRPASKVVELEKFSELQAALIKNGEPELFVLDLLLPGVKGATAISDVKKMYPEVPLVVLSAMPSGEARDACLEAGADLYIEKSTDTTEISQAIHDIMKSDDDEADAAADAAATDAVRSHLDGTTSTRAADTTGYPNDPYSLLKRGRLLTGEAAKKK
jgi:DNA-binding NarL/FixJ family response regulator